MFIAAYVVLVLLHANGLNVPGWVSLSLSILAILEGSVYVVLFVTSVICALADLRKIK